MKLGVIALDYDGTIAEHDQLHPDVRDAIADARTRGIVVCLVTGRSLEALRRVAGDLHLVDVVIGENGAVVHFPGVEYTTVLPPPVPASVSLELQRCGRLSTRRAPPRRRREPRPDRRRRANVLCPVDFSEFRRRSCRRTR